MIIKLIIVLRDIYKHFLTYILRTAFLQVTLTVGGSYLLSWLFRGILVASGFPGLSIDNILSFLTDPVTFLLLILYLLILAFLVFIEFSFLVEILRYKETPLELGFSRFKADLVNVLQSLKGRHFFSFLAYLAITIPALRFFFSSALIERLYIPSFITGELQKSLTGQIGLFLIYAVIFYLNIRLIYTLPLAVIRQHKTFTDNLRTSWEMTSGKSLLTLIGLAIIAGIIGLISLVLSSLVLGILYLFFKGDNSGQLIAQTLLLSLVWLIIFAANLLAKLASVSYLVLTLEHHHVIDSQPTQTPQKSRWIGLLVLNLTIGIIAFFYHAAIISNGDPQDVTIIGHRGFVQEAVENSLEGLAASKKAGANMVELDVLMTKDKQLVICHDNHLKCLAGQNITVSQSYAKDIIGKTLHQNGHTSHIVSFRDFVTRAKQLNLPLLIELKPAKGQSDFAKVFSKELDTIKLSTKNKIMSIDVDLIEQVEKSHPEFQTGHVITFQIGDFETNDVDFYAIEEFSYSNRLANIAHSRGKDIYIWTINNDQQLETYLESSVDGIITDYPDKARRKQAYLSSNQDYISFISHVFNLG